MLTLFQNIIYGQLDKHPVSSAFAKEIAAGTALSPFYTASETLRHFFLSWLREKTGKKILIVLPSDREVADLVLDLSLLGKKPVILPWWETLPYSFLDPESPVFAKRASVLSEIASAQPGIIVASTRAFLTPVPPKKEILSLSLQIQKGMPLDLKAVGEKLSAMGYLRVPGISVAGEFAVRGEVLDIFPGSSDQAYRLVCGWNTIEQIKVVDPVSMRSVGTEEKLLIRPLKEVRWEAARIEALSKRLGAAFKDIEEYLSDPSVRGDEVLFPCAFENKHSILEYLDPETILIQDGSQHIATRAAHAKKEVYLGFKRVRNESPFLPQPEDIIWDYDEMMQKAPAFWSWHSLRENADTRAIKSDTGRTFFSNVNFFREEASGWLKSGYRVFVFAGSEAQALRVRHLLKDVQGLKVLDKGISAGFLLPELKLAVVEENELFGRRRKEKLSISKVRSRPIDTFVELNEGDYVVHVQHGIGIFRGIQRMTVSSQEKDYIQINYADEEAIFIPLEQVNLIQKFIGQDGGAPRMDRIGSKSWENKKARVRAAVQELADRLVKLYSRRKLAQGHAYAPDTDWQYQFEASFPFEETIDQLKCVEEIKEDMESTRPMDRLVCGDVGYGKTEVAMRAAFKAVMDGRQVAVLAPTTILAEQHFENFSERMKSFPVKVAMLSRFVSKAEQKETIKKTAEGEVDIVIGTHRIFSKDVIFKNLGLLVLDEEQRFGVKDKERLKEMKASIDCLALSATPIPRTLHMSLLKIRDMSLLTTAPSNRKPIQTHIEEFSEKIVVEAVRKEIARGGQVFFLHNRIESMEFIRTFITQAMPEILVDVAHGQMAADEIEDVMHRFIHGAFQVLISTAIIENGIDIPNVNTIIIDRADLFGISQLYQLRGLVGRSGKIAYAYLLYPESRALNELAMKRLKIISDNTELGSGFKVAMKDMEVRGAGNLLGPQQHGEIMAVGFDMYMRILDEAIRAQMKDQGEAVPPEVYLELEYTGFIPDSYVSEAMDKMEIYKKIGGIMSEDELAALNQELDDRFGPVPVEVQNLLAIAKIRILCQKLHVASLKEKRDWIEVELGRVSMISADRVVRLIQETNGQVRIDPARPHVILMKKASISLMEKAGYIEQRLSSLMES